MLLRPIDRSIDLSRRRRLRRRLRRRRFSFSSSRERTPTFRIGKISIYILSCATSSSLKCRLFSLSLSFSLRREKKRERDLLDERRARTVRDRKKKTDALSLSVSLPPDDDSSVLKGSRRRRRRRRSKNVRFPLTAGQSRLVRAVFANNGNAADERSHLDVFEYRWVFQTPSVYRALEERIWAGLLHQRRSRWRSVLRYYARRVDAGGCRQDAHAIGSE